MAANSESKLFDTSGATDKVTEKDFAVKVEQNIDIYSKSACTGNEEKSERKITQGKERFSDTNDCTCKTRTVSEVTEDENVSVKSSWSDVSDSTEEETSIASRTKDSETLARLKISSKKQTSRGASSKKKKDPGRKLSNLKESNVDLPESRSGAAKKERSSTKKPKSKTPSKENATSEFGVLDSDESTEEKGRRIPSQVKDIPWITAVSPKKYKPRKGDSPDRRYEGKWMIFANCQSKIKDGLTKLDRLWFKIEEMVENGELYGAHVSTSCPNTKPPKVAGPGSGTICCATRDYRNEEDVKLTAKKIMDKLSQDYNGHLLYKTNETSDNDGLSLYRYCQGGSFWKRNDQDKWICLSK